MEVLWKELEVCDIRGNGWNYVGEYGSSWKLPRNIFMEAAIDGSNRTFHFHRQWKLPCISMEASTNFRGGKSTSINFHVNFDGSKSTSTDFHDFHGSKFASMEVDQKDPVRY